MQTGTTSTKTYVKPSYNFGGGGSYGYMPGGLDEVRIWSNARTAFQIVTNYTKSLTATDDLQGLVGYWPMDDNSGGIIHYAYCNNNDAVLHTTAEIWASTGAPVNDFNYVEYADRFIVPNHRLPTVYAYNSLNQVIQQTTPDGGTSQFWYDCLGRLTVSQNAEQKSPLDVNDPANRYSYTLYDALGRIA